MAIEFAIPEYLQRDIREFVRGINEKARNIDCLADELQGSINMAMLSEAITGQQSELLRAYYIDGGIFDGVI